MAYRVVWSPRVVEDLEPIARYIAVDSGAYAAAVLKNSPQFNAWSIVDSVNRLRDLLREAPGVRHESWWELFMRRTKDIDSLRNDIQHQTDKARLKALVASAGQIWGFLSWAEIRNERYTGVWYLMSPGAVYGSDRWIYAGPPLPSEPLPLAESGYTRMVERFIWEKSSRPYMMRLLISLKLFKMSP